MNKTFDNNDALVREIDRYAAELALHERPILISIDGLGGAGKSTLARGIASIADTHIVSVDDYLIPNLGTYLPHLRYDDLEADLNSVVAQSFRFVIVEGLCILSVLERLDRQSDISVYIRRMDQNGEWSDEFYYSEDNNLDEVLGRLAEIDARYPDMPGIGDEDRELVKYHIEKRPITRALYVYDHVRRPPAYEEPC